MNHSQPLQPLPAATAAQVPATRYHVVDLGVLTIVRAEGLVSSQRFVVVDSGTNQLVAHPGLPVPKLYVNRAEADQALDLINDANPPVQGPTVYTGWISVAGTRIQADFQAPAQATDADRALAFLAALSAEVELDYLALGELPPCASSHPSRQAPAIPTSP